MVPTFRSALFILAFTICVTLDAQTELRHYRETHGSRVSIVQYSVIRTGQEIIARSSDGTGTDEIHWMPGTGTVSWRETDAQLDNDISAERTGNLIHIKGRFRGKEIQREVRVDSAPWYQIFGPIMSDLLPPDLAAREFWVINPDDLTPHKMLVRREGAETLPFRGSRIEANKIHFSPAGTFAAFWGADFWYRQGDGAWVYSRLPENGGVTVNGARGTRRRRRNPHGSGGKHSMIFGAWRSSA